MLPRLAPPSLPLLVPRKKKRGWGRASEGEKGREERTRATVRWASLCHRKGKERSRHLLRDLRVSGKLLLRPNSQTPILKSTGTLISNLTPNPRDLTTRYTGGALCPRSDQNHSYLVRPDSIFYLLHLSMRPPSQTQPTAFLQDFRHP